MSRIQFKVCAIELKDSTLEQLDPGFQFRLNLTQRPVHIREDIFLDTNNQLQNLNHTWNFNDFENRLYGATLTLRSVLKKLVFQCENSRCYLHDDYDEAEHSLIGYCTIIFKDLLKDVPNNLTIELIPRGEVHIVGYVKLEIIISPISEIFQNSEQKLKLSSKGKQKKRASKPKKNKNPTDSLKNIILAQDTNRLLC